MAFIEIYCDECRQDLISNKKSINEHNQYIVLGGIWIAKEYREDFKNQFKALQTKYNVYGEVKWNKVSNSKLEFYKKVVKLFFKYSEDKVSFRSIVIDAKKIDVDMYDKGSSELGFYKFYYQLIYHKVENNDQYSIFLDYRKDKSKRRAYELKQFINKKCKNNIIENVQFINSKESILLQVEDVIMGAVGYKFNYGYKGKSKAKNEIVKLIEKYQIIDETSKNEKKFNIFKIKLKEGKD